MKEIRDALRGFITENFLFGMEGDFADGDSLLEQGIVDSTGVLELIGFLESSFQISVEDDELTPDNLDSIDNLVRFITTKSNGRPKAMTGS